jgi:IclR family transcriptional regulator, acetate operon repressor
VADQSRRAVVPNEDPDQAKNSAATVERAADVLLLFAQSSTQLGVTEIATKLELSKAAVHRILGSLRNKGIVELDPATRRYALGPIVMSLGVSYINQLNIRSMAAAELAALSRATNETATLSVRSGRKRVYVDQVTPNRDVLMSVQMGVPYPLHAGASSKAILAFLPEPEIAELLRLPLERLTPLTITDPATLRRELSAIRERGWASSGGERQTWAASEAAPVLGASGYPVAAISICGPAERVTSRASEHAELLLAATSRVSARMGYVRHADGERRAP